jgi:hypothetical protein
MRPAAALLLAACVASAPLTASGWGAPGHMTTAALAERHLSGGAAAAASADLATFRSLYPTESDFVTAADWCACGWGRTRLFRSGLDPFSCVFVATRRRARLRAPRRTAHQA